MTLVVILEGQVTVGGGIEPTNFTKKASDWEPPKVFWWPPEAIAVVDWVSPAK
jgi:hypothetical protein